MKNSIIPLMFALATLNLPSAFAQTAAPRFTVGELVYDDGQPVTVVSVDASGAPTLQRAGDKDTYTTSYPEQLGRTDAATVKQGATYALPKPLAIREEVYSDGKKLTVVALDASGRATLKGEDGKLSTDSYTNQLGRTDAATVKQGATYALPKPLAIGEKVYSDGKKLTVVALDASGRATLKGEDGKLATDSYTDQLGRTDATSVKPDATYRLTRPLAIGEPVFDDAKPAKVIAVDAEGRATVQFDGDKHCYANSFTNQLGRKDTRCIASDATYALKYPVKIDEKVFDNGRAATVAAVDDAGRVTIKYDGTGKFSTTSYPDQLGRLSPKAVSPNAFYVLKKAPLKIGEDVYFQGKLGAVAAFDFEGRATILLKQPFKDKNGDLVQGVASSETEEIGRIDKTLTSPEGFKLGTPVNYKDKKGEIVAIDAKQRATLRLADGSLFQLPPREPATLTRADTFVQSQTPASGGGGNGVEVKAGR